MLNKNVCPKCGQLYDPDLSKCPLCGENAPKHGSDGAEIPESASARKHSAAFLHAEEQELLRNEEKRQKDEKRKTAKIRSDSGKIPSGFLCASIIILSIAAVLCIFYLLWCSGIIHLTAFDKISNVESTSAETSETEHAPSTFADSEPTESSVIPTSARLQTEMPSTDYSETEPSAGVTEQTPTELVPTEPVFSETESETEEVTEPAIILPFDFSLDDARYVLVNDDNPIPDGFDVEQLGTYSLDSGAVVLSLCIEDLNDMMKDVRKAQNDSKYIRVLKGFDADADVTSEYRTGLAVDVFYCGASQSYDVSQQRDSNTLIWLAEHSWEYGFVLRYPEGKESVTGHTYEPWHFRYIGKDAAAYAHENDLCLEELIELMRQAG